MDNEELDILNYELQRRKDLEPLRFFKPNGAQQRFLNTIKKDDSEICVFPAGNWTGKTAASIVALAACIWPEQAEDEIFNHPLFKNWPYPKKARIITTPKEMGVNGSIQPEIKRWFPSGRYKSDKQGKLYPSLFTTKAWVIDTMTYDQALTEFEGGTIGLFILNEPPPEDIFDTCRRRMKFGGKILLPATPLANAAWIWDRLISKDNQKGIYVVYGRTEDNCIDHGINGVIPHAAIESMANGCADEDERAACLEGKFMHLSGCIFKGFKREVHVIKDVDQEQFLPGKQIYQIVDPAIGKPLAVIWATVDALGIITIYQEWPAFEFQGAKDSNMTVQDYAELFKATEGHYKAHTRILDRHFGNTRRTLGGLTLKQEFEEFKIDFEDSYSIGDNSSEVETGILKVKDLLRYNTAKPISNLNRPRLYVCESCTNTIHSLERWSRDPKTGKPKEEQKDFCDDVRYLAMAGPFIEEPRPWETKTSYYGVGN